MNIGERYNYIIESYYSTIDKVRTVKLTPLQEKLYQREYTNFIINENGCFKTNRKVMFPTKKRVAKRVSQHLDEMEMSLEIFKLLIK